MRAPLPCGCWASACAAGAPDHSLPPALGCRVFDIAFSIHIRVLQEVLQSVEYVLLHFKNLGPDTDDCHGVSWQVLIAVRCYVPLNVTFYNSNNSAHSRGSSSPGRLLRFLPGSWENEALLSFRPRFI